MFDPYRKWLGILPKDQPPHHYRLLSLEVFENDLDVIEGAADRAMSFVRQYQSGEHAALAAKLLNEIAGARLCLLKRDAKAKYDTELRQQIASTVVSNTVTPNTIASNDESTSFANDSETAELVNSSPAIRKKKRKKSRSLPVSYLVGGGVAVLIVLMAIVSNQGKPTSAMPQSAANPTTKINQDSMPVASVTPSAAAPTMPVPTSPPVVTRTPLPAPRTPPKAAEVTPPTSLSPDEPKDSVVSIGPVTNLLEGVDLKRDVWTGTWKKEGTSLVSGHRSWIYLPGKFPDDYRLKYKIKRVDDNDTLLLGFVMGGRSATFAIDANNATVCGLYLDRREPNNNSTTRRMKLFENGRTSTVVMTVHADHLHVSFDDKTILDWYGSPERLFHYDDHCAPHLGTANIGTARASYQIESAEMSPIGPERHETRVVRLETKQDLMPLLNAERGGRRRDWDVSNGVLRSPETPYAQFALPVRVPEEYSLSATVTFPPGAPTFVVGLIAGHSNFSVVLRNKFSLGIERIDGLRFDQNETRRDGPSLEPGHAAKIVWTVNRTGVRMEVDGRTFINWNGDFQRLSVQDDWAPLDSRRIFFGTMGSFKFSDLELGPPVDPPIQPPHPPVKGRAPVDLLTLVDVQRDTLSGTWEKDGSSLRALGDARLNKLAIPREVPAEYKLTLRVAREPGAKHDNEGFVLKLPTESSMGQVIIDGGQSTISGLCIDRLNFDDARNPSSKRIKAIPPGPAQKLEIFVRRTGLKVMKGTTEIVDWSGNPNRLWQQAEWATPAGQIALCSYYGRFRIETLEIEELEPSSFSPMPQLGDDGNLLATIDVGRDSRTVKWKKTPEGIVSPAIVGTRLSVPVTPPTQYVVSADVERRSGNCQICFGLVVGGRTCDVVIGGGNGNEVGLERLDDHDFANRTNPTHRKLPEALLPQGKRVQIHCFVQPNMIIAICGGKEILRWQGDPRRLSLEGTYLPPNYSETDRTQLWLGAWDSEFLIRALRLRPLSDAEAIQIAREAPDPAKYTAGLNVAAAPSIPDSDTPENGDVVLLINMNSGRCMSTNGEGIIQGPLPKSAQLSERWKLVLAGDRFKIINEQSHKVLAVSQGSNVSGRQLIQFKDLKSDDQKWQFIKVGKHYAIKSQINGQVAGVAYSSKDANAQVVQWPLEEIPDQIWRIQKASTISKSINKK